MTQLSDYLAQFEHISDVTPMTLTIRGKSYDACSYVAKFNTPVCPLTGSIRARRLWRIIYCIGGLPSVYRRNTRVAFSIAGDPSDWYIASYWPYLYAHMHKQDLSAVPGEHQPFGPNFLLTQWDVKEPIDKYEPTKRQRVQITLS